jgi:hypothetical protein
MPLASVTFLAMGGQHISPSIGIGRFTTYTPMRDMLVFDSTVYQFSKVLYNNFKFRQIRVLLSQYTLNQRAICL